jgi:hypothetical protein
VCRDYYYYLIPVASYGAQGIRETRFHFSFLILQADGRLLWWGIIPSQGCYLHTGKHNLRGGPHAGLLARNQCVLRPGISTHTLVVFLCLQANAEMVPIFRAATAACFSCRPPDVDNKNRKCSRMKATKSPLCVL